MHIGLIGGIGPAATDYYYRFLIGALRDQGADFDITIVHANSWTLLDNQAQDQRDTQSDIFANLADRLRTAGADCVAVTSIAGHFCHREFAQKSVLPVCNLLDAVTAHLNALGIRRIGIMGTGAAMRSGFYGALGGFDIIAGSPEDQQAIHDTYVAVASRGAIRPEETTVFQQAGKALVHTHGAEAVLLGGTDLVLAFPGGKADFPVIDCAELHALDIVAHSITSP